MGLIKDLVIDGFDNKPIKQWPAFDDTMLDRTKYVSASEIGGCAREIAYSKKASPHHGELNGYAERGHTAEEWIVVNIRRSKLRYQLFYAGEEQRSFYNEYQSGTPDGLLLTPEGEYILIEIKCIDPRTNWSTLPKPMHKTQCTQNMDLLMRCHDTMKIDRAIIVYVDASNYENIKEFEVTYDADEASRLRVRARQIMSLKSPVDATPEGIYVGGCKFCRFKDVCSGAVEQAKRENEKMKGLKNASTNFFS